MVSKASSALGSAAIRRFAAAARLAEVDVAGQLADDQDVQPATSSGLRLERMRQLLVADRRAEVGEQAEVLAQAEDGLLGRSARSSLSYFQSPTAPNSTASAVLARFSVAPAAGGRRLVGRAAHRRRFHRSRTSGRGRHCSTLGLRDDLGADAVARQDGDLQAGWSSLGSQGIARCGRSQGFFSSRSASKARILSAWRRSGRCRRSRRAGSTCGTA